VRSLVTCEGGGAITAGAGMESFEAWVFSRCGAETGGGTMIALAAEGPRSGGGSRGTSFGEGCTMGVVIDMTAFERSRGTSLGAGAMTVAVVSPVTWRARSAAALDGGGATTLLFRRGIERSSSRMTSGGGATMAFFEKDGVGVAAFRPSAGGGPGIDFSASRLATGASETGRLTLGASTTFSAQRGWFAYRDAPAVRRRLRCGRPRLRRNPAPAEARARSR